MIHVAQGSDGAALSSIYAPIVRETVISFETEPPSADEMSARVETTLASHPWLVWSDGGQVTGYAYAGPHRSRPAYRWSCDVTVYVGEHARRRGVAHALYTSLFDLLRQQGLRSAFAGITLPNAASVSLHKRLGFTPVGTYENVGFKHDSWHAVGWWGLELQPLSDAPTEPIAFAALDPDLKPT